MSMGRWSFNTIRFVIIPKPLAGWANDNVNEVIESNKKIIKELTDLRMKVLEI